MLGALGDVGGEGGEGEEWLDSGERLEACKDFEFREGNGNFGLMVWVGELRWVLLVKFGGEIFVGVELKGKGFVYRQDLGKNISICFRNIGREGEYGVLSPWAEKAAGRQSCL